MRKFCLAAALSAAIPATSFGAILYSNNFETDTTASWTVNSGPTTPTPIDYVSDFYYDAQTSIGVPASVAGSSRVLKLTANNSAGVFGGVSVSPTGQSFTGSYKVSFNLWQNYAGPLGPGGSGTTQLSNFGIQTSGTQAQYPGVVNSVFFAASLDGGSANDYRAYSSAATAGYASGNAVYQSAGHPTGVNNDSQTYYATKFLASSAPAAQVALFPGQTGSTNAGEISFAWRAVEILVDGGFATWTVDGVQMARVNLTGLTSGGNNIFLGHSDTNAAASTDLNDALLNVTLIDNLVVESVPEPTTLVGLAAAGLIALRRRR